MNAELLAMLGGASAGPSRREVEPKTLISFKAGKMNAERQQVSEAARTSTQNKESFSY
jgi:hypothetical protein